MKKLRCTAAVSVLLLLCFEARAQQRRLDVTNFVVLGEGLAAGLADFSLTDFHQSKSFPAQMARQMDTILPQPLIQVPGIGPAPGVAALPVRVPTPPQTTVRQSPTLFVFNLSVPGYRLSDSIHRRPTLPLVHQKDAQQTASNLILGFPALLLKDVPLWTQLEYAQQMQPTFVLVALGYSEVTYAAVQGDSRHLPDVASFRSDYSRIITELRSTFAEILVVTIPDLTETAYFSSPEAATRLVGAPASVLRALYQLKAGDVFTAGGLMEVGNQLLARTVGPLPAASVVSAGVLSEIRARVAALNSEINSIAQQNGALVYDVNGLFRRVRNSGVLIGNRVLTADYLGGFYSLNGLYPGTTGHGLIANEILDLLNRTYGESFKPVDLVALLATDPTAVSLSRARPEFSLEELEKFIPNLRELLKRQSGIEDPGGFR